MNLLLDTHVVIWWLNEPERISKRAHAVISNQANSVYVSAATAWEIAIKTNLGKLQSGSLAFDLETILEDENFLEQPITIEHAVRGGLLPMHHRDPFDRLLIAQAQLLKTPIVSADSVLDRYDVKRIW